MKKRKILHALIYAVLTLGALLVFFPFYLTVVSSLKDMSDIFSNFFGLPRHIVFDNFCLCTPETGLFHRTEKLCDQSLV